MGIWESTWLSVLATINNNEKEYNEAFYGNPIVHHQADVWKGLLEPELRHLAVLLPPGNALLSDKSTSIPSFMWFSSQVKFSSCFSPHQFAFQAPQKQNLQGILHRKVYFFFRR